jgi:hypothetical protein
MRNHASAVPNKEAGHGEADNRNEHDSYPPSHHTAAPADSCTFMSRCSQPIPGAEERANGGLGLMEAAFSGRM